MKPAPPVTRSFIPVLFNRRPGCADGNLPMVVWFERRGLTRAQSELL
ncbi:hypothetical protein ACFPRL_11525 [Pseudoclavibacter helvolus]